MSKGEATSKDIAVCAAAALAYIWLAAWIWELLPDSRGQWWGIPAWLTTVLGAFVVFWALLLRKR